MPEQKIHIDSKNTKKETGMLKNYSFIKQRVYERLLPLNKAGDKRLNLKSILKNRGCQIGEDLKKLLILL